MLKVDELICNASRQVASGPLLGFGWYLLVVLIPFGEVPRALWGLWCSRWDVSLHNVVDEAGLLLVGWFC